MVETHSFGAQQSVRGRHGPGYHCPRVAVVIPTHNRHDALLQCLECVVALEGVPCRCVVVFDGCTDGSQEAVRKSFPHTLMIEADGTLWWSGSINAGIKAARGLGVQYVCLLNDDVQPEPGMLRALVHAAEQHPGALIGSKICHLRQPTRLWGAGGRTDWLRSGTSMRGNGREDGPEWCCLAEVDWLPGMGTLIPASVIDRIGSMDANRFPQYFGDADFSLRARRAGIRCVVCPEAKLLNDVESTGNLLPAGAMDWKEAAALLCSLRSHANWRTRWRFWLRHCPAPLIPWQAVRFYAPLLAAIAKKLLLNYRKQPLCRAQKPNL